MGERTDTEAIRGQSPFREIPTITTLAEEQLRYVQEASQGLAQDFWTAFESHWGPPYKQNPPVTIDLGTLREKLNKKRGVTVYSQEQGYLMVFQGRSRPKIIRPEDRKEYSNTRERNVAVSVSANEKGGYLYFAYSDSRTHSLGASQIERLFQVGIPVLLVHLLTFGPHKVGQEIANITTRQRLGEGIEAKERDKYIVLKLAQSDAKGNVILTQRVG